MSTTPRLAISLTFGLRVEPIDPDFDDLLEPAEQLLSGVLGVPLAWSDDVDLGGTFLEYAPRPLPEAGLAGVRIHRNHLYDDVWAAPHRRDLPLVAYIELCATADLLDAGRLAAAIYAHAGDRAALTSYVVSPVGLDNSGAELWRAHITQFTTDDAGARRWRPDRSPIGDDIRWSDAAVSPVLVGYLAFAVRAKDLPAALAAVQRVWPVSFVAGFDPDIGGDYHVYDASDGSSVLLRHHAIDAYVQLFSECTDVAYLLDVRMRTQSLLDLGRLAAELEAHGGFEAIAYRAVGDLVHDRVPRLLTGRPDLRSGNA
jgi:hypothetical protein